MRKSALAFFLIMSLCTCSAKLKTKKSVRDLRFMQLSPTRDEGIPLGNGVVGALVWQKDSVLRMSLDRSDLWDLRPGDSIAGVNNRFKWVYEQRMKGDYRLVRGNSMSLMTEIPLPQKFREQDLNLT